MQSLHLLLPQRDFFFRGLLESVLEGAMGNEYKPWL